jgi:hypothetical protein
MCRTGYVGGLQRQFRTVSQILLKKSISRHEVLMWMECMEVLTTESPALSTALIVKYTP